MSDPNRYLDLVRTQTVFKDGAMGTQIQDANLDDAAYGGYPGNVDHLTLSAPDVIRNIHRAYLDAGADYVITNSFQSTRLRLEEWGLGEQTLEHNRAAAAAGARDVRRVRDRRPGRASWPARSGPTGMLPSGNDPTLSAITYPELVELFREQTIGLLAGGADLLQIETMQDILETRAAITGAAAGLHRGRSRGAAAGVGGARRDRPDAARHRHRRGRRDPPRHEGRHHRHRTAPSGPSTCASRCGTCARSATCRSSSCRTPGCR